MTTYKVSNLVPYPGCIVYELWDGHEVKKYRFNDIEYNGGDIETFIKKNLKKLSSYTINYDNLNAYLEGKEFF